MRHNKHIFCLLFLSYYLQLIFNGINIFFARLQRLLMTYVNAFRKLKTFSIYTVALAMARLVLCYWVPWKKIANSRRVPGESLQSNITYQLVIRIALLRNWSACTRLGKQTCMKLYDFIHYQYYQYQIGLYVWKLFATLAPKTYRFKILH